MRNFRNINIKKWLESPVNLIFAVFFTITAYFLLTEHTAHVFGLLPYALLLLCPFLHLFMHGKHGHHNAEMSDEKHKHEL